MKAHEDKGFCAPFSEQYFSMNFLSDPPAPTLGHKLDAIFNTDAQALVLSYVSLTNDVFWHQGLSWCLNK